MNRLSKIILWIPTFAVILFFTFISFMSLSEWWNVKILKEIDKYAWGSINENSWFYETPNIYANVQLIEGVFMLFLVVMTSVKIIQKNPKFKYWLLSCFIFFILMFVSSNII